METGNGAENVAQVEKTAGERKAEEIRIMIMIRTEPKKERWPPAGLGLPARFRRAAEDD
jgi:hypothetical protein